MREIVELTVVAPMFNEEQGIGEFCTRLRGSLDSLATRYEVLIVDDGSTDGSIQEVLDLEWPQCRVVSLATNVGHQRAIEAGLSLAKGTHVVTMDSDGQHPPELIPEMLSLVLSDPECDVVYTVRSKRGEEGVTKRSPALIYYRLVRWLTGIDVPDSQADFRLISRRVVDTINDVRGDKVVRVLLPSLGYGSNVLEYQAGERIAGKSRFGTGHQVRLAIDSIFGFSSKPLRLVATMGWFLSIAAFVWLGIVVITWALDGAVSGWPSVMGAVLLVGGMSLLGLSIIGAYVARVHDILKNHPRFVVRGIGDSNPPREIK